MKNNLFKRRRTIEIYFVLYLAALILLLPDRPNPDGNNNSIISNPDEFILRVQKPVLYCKLLNDSIGTRILSFDSVNTIYYSGKVSDVRFEFEIIDEDQNQRLILNPEKRTATEYFSYRENNAEKNVAFYWKPPFELKLNKTYLVKVIATAIPNEGEKTGIKPDINSKEMAIGNRMKKETAFSLSYIYMNKPQELFSAGNYLGQTGNQSELNQIMSLPAEASQSQGLITLHPVFYQVDAFAYQKWNNKIFVLGMNLEKDLAKVPEIEINRRPDNNKGTAYITSISANEIQLSGITPISGNINVKLTVSRKNDKKEATVDFFVEPLAIYSPEFESVMYPDETYRIDPKIPQSYGQEIKTLIKDGNTIKLESRQGAKFDFSPSASDTGKVLSLERYVNDNLIGQTYQIFIKAYPEPEILFLKKIKDGVVRIKTLSYGSFNSKKNTIVSLQIDGNAEWREFYPNTPEEYSKNRHYQNFEIIPRQTALPFDFRVWAVDSRGKKSDVMSYRDK